MSQRNRVLQDIIDLPLGKKNDRYRGAHKFSKKMTKPRQVRALLQENKIRLMEREACKQKMADITKKIRMDRMAPLPMKADPILSSKDIIEKLKEKRSQNTTKLLPEDHNITRITSFPTINSQIRSLRDLGVGWRNINASLHTQHIVPISDGMI